MRWAMACHIPIFGEMTAQRIDDLGTLAHQQIAGSEHNRARLLFLALDGHKVHGRPLRCFADGFRVSRIVSFSARSCGAIRCLDFSPVQPACIVAIEACASAHYWAREIAKHGHTTRLIAAHYVKPFVKRTGGQERQSPCATSRVLRPLFPAPDMRSIRKNGGSDCFRSLAKHRSWLGPYWPLGDGQLVLLAAVWLYADALTFGEDWLAIPAQVSNLGVHERSPKSKAEFKAAWKALRASRSGDALRPETRLAFALPGVVMQSSGASCVGTRAVLGGRLSRKLRRCLSGRRPQIGLLREYLAAGRPHPQQRVEASR